MLKILLAGGLVAGLLGTAAVDPAPSERVVIDVVTVSGSGCVGASASFDGDALTISYESFVARVGPEILPVDTRRSCQFSLLIHPPSGQTYAFGGARHSGFASLAVGANAVLRTNVFAAGQPTTPFRIHTFTGPLIDYVVVEEPSDPATVFFAPCGALRTTNVSLDLRVNAGTSDPRRNSSSIALNESVTLPLILRSCSA